MLLLLLCVGAVSAGLSTFHQPHPSHSRHSITPSARYPGDSSAVNFGFYEASALDAVVVEAFPNSNRASRQFKIKFPKYVTSEKTEESNQFENTNCKGYSMLGCI